MNVFAPWKALRRMPPLAPARPAPTRRLGSIDWPGITFTFTFTLTGTCRSHACQGHHRKIRAGSTGCAGFATLAKKCKKEAEMAESRQMAQKPQKRWTPSLKPKDPLGPLSLFEAIRGHLCNFKLANWPLQIVLPGLNPRDRDSLRARGALITPVPRPP